MLIAPIKTHIRQFFDRRAKLSDTHRFGLNNTYVFTSKQGILFLILLLTTFIAGINYGNNLVLALFFYLVSVWLVAVVVAFMQMTALTIEFKNAELTQTGEVTWVTLAISTKAKVARQIALSFDDYEEKHTLSAFDNDHYQQHRILLLKKVDNTPQLIKLPMIAKKRGANELPRLKLSSQFPLGIVVAWSYARFSSMMWAYPKPIAFDMAAHRPINANHENEMATSGIAGLNDFDRLDTYIEGENLSRVSWGHAARGLGLLTKHFLDTTGQEQVLHYTNMPATHHEDKLAMLVFAIQSVQNNPTPFAMVLPSNSGQTIEFGTGQAFCEQCLLRLAKEP